MLLQEDVPLVSVFCEFILLFKGVIHSTKNPKCPQYRSKKKKNKNCGELISLYNTQNLWTWFNQKLYGYTILGPHEN